MKTSARWLVLMVLMAAAQAQVAGQIRRATISGSGGTSGKCTIEVRVDMLAEIDVYGDSGRLRTIAGQPATWTRLECTDSLPYGMSDFRLSGIDGRGSVKLVQDPRNNNSMAVIRIEDPSGGSDGYTFEISWSGASGGAPTGGFATGWGGPAAGGTSPPSTTGSGRGRGGWGDRLTAERAMDLCRTEVRARSERDYGLRNIDITSTAVDSGQGRRDWITGAFSDRSSNRRRASGYRFNCQVDYSSGQVRNVEILRADGSTLQPGSLPGTSSQTTPYNPAGYDQTRAIRACQDAVVARANRDGYQNVNFGSSAIDTSRSEWISGTITASRGPVTDTFNFGCSMDAQAASVRNVELNRR